MEISKEPKVGCVIRGSDHYVSQQGPEYTPGVSAETAGSRVLFLGIVTIPPQSRTSAHIHEHHESGFYFLSGGAVEFYTGEQLEHRELAHPGDYVFIPPKVPHVAVNRNPTPAVFVGVRNEPTAQESVVLRPELDTKVP